MAAITICSDFGAQKNKVSHCLHFPHLFAMKLKDTPWKESYDQPRQHIEKQRHYFAKNGPSSQSSGFSSSHVWMDVRDGL